MDKLKSINSIKDFMAYCKVTDGIEIVVNAEINKKNKIIHQGIANIYCSYDVGYRQYRVAIIWDFDDDLMREIGLHGSYNTNYQRFSYSSGVLTIHDADFDINIYKR